MKKLLFFTVLVIGVSFSQDLLTTVSGTEYKGVFVGQQGKYILFEPVGSSTSQKIPITTLSKVKLDDGEVFEFGNDILTTKTGDTYEGYYIATEESEVQFLVKKDMQVKSFEKIIIDNIKLSGERFVNLELVNQGISEEEIIENEYNRQVKQLCDKNKLINVLIIPLKNDYYGLSEIIEEHHDSLCFNIVENIDALEYLHKEDIELDKINDYHLIKAGQSLSANFVIYGFIYKFDVPYKYSSITSDPAAILIPKFSDFEIFSSDLLYSMRNSYLVRKQKSDRNKAISEAGTYIKVTYFSINTETGEKIYLIRNQTVMKLG